MKLVTTVIVCLAVAVHCQSRRGDEYSSSGLSTKIQPRGTDQTFPDDDRGDETIVTDHHKSTSSSPINERQNGSSDTNMIVIEKSSGDNEDKMEEAKYKNMFRHKDLLEGESVGIMNIDTLISLGEQDTINSSNVMDSMITIDEKIVEKEKEEGRSRPRTINWALLVLGMGMTIVLVAAVVGSIYSCFWCYKKSQSSQMHADFESGEQ